MEKEKEMALRAEALARKWGCDPADLVIVRDRIFPTGAAVWTVASQALAERGLTVLSIETAIFHNGVLQSTDDADIYRLRDRQGRALDVPDTLVLVQAIIRLGMVDREKGTVTTVGTVVAHGAATYMDSEVSVSIFQGLPFPANLIMHAETRAVLRAARRICEMFGRPLPAVAEEVGVIPSEAEARPQAPAPRGGPGTETPPSPPPPSPPQPPPPPPPEEEAGGKGGEVKWDALLTPGQVSTLASTCARAGYRTTKALQNLVRSLTGRTEADIALSSLTVLEASWVVGYVNYWSEAVAAGVEEAEAKRYGKAIAALGRTHNIPFRQAREYAEAHPQEFAEALRAVSEAEGKGGSAKGRPNGGRASPPAEGTLMDLYE